MRRAFDLAKNAVDSPCIAAWLSLGSERLPEASLRCSTSASPMPVLSEVQGQNDPPFKIARTETVTLRIKKLSEHAVLPKRGSAKAAGYDLSRCARSLLTASPTPDVATSGGTTD